MANTPVRQYIGARYVPLFADPAEWDNQRTYEPLTIVIHHGNSYTSRQYVPVGIDINNTDFWALTGNYNAQVEQYRKIAQAGQTANDLLTKMGITDNTSAVNHINEVEQSHDSTVNNTKALTALGAETVDKATALKNYIHNPVTGKTYNILIGDSWTQHGAGPWNTGNTWSEIISNKLGLKYLNYAKGGTGFVRQINGTDFTTQAQEAATQTQYPHDECAFIFIMGGNNDVGTLADFDAYVRNIDTVYNTLKNAYPAATIVMTGLNCPMGHYFGSNLTKYAKPLKTYGESHGDIIFVDNPADYAFSPEITGLVQYHPTQLGSQIIARKVLASMYGANQHSTTITTQKVWGYIRHYFDGTNATATTPRDIHSTLIKNENNATVNMFITGLVSDPDDDWDIAFNSTNVYWDVETSTPPAPITYILKGKEAQQIFITGTCYVNDTPTIVNFEYKKIEDNKVCFKLITKGLTPNFDTTKYLLSNVNITYTTPYPYGAFNGTKFNIINE